MKTRPLGPSGIEASVVAFGAWAIGGWMWGEPDDDASVRAIHAFLDAGGTLIDTAPIYGFGHSEEVVGRAIQGRRDQVVVATKCGMRWDLSPKQLERASHKFSTTKEIFDRGEPTPDSFDVSIYNGADGIREEVERSLERLGVETIDLYQTHWQQDSTPIDERMEALLRLKDEGKIRAIGVSNASPEQIDAYRAAGQLDTDQEMYSMLDRGLESTNLAKCADDGLALLAYCPMAQGLLTGKTDPHREYPRDDQRRENPRFAPDNVRKVLSMLEPFGPIAEAHGATVGQVSMAWTLAVRGCSHVLCGARNAEQAQENCGAGDLELTPDELATITAAVDGYDGV
ncbi:General stress protein 69 [Pseudobythopirellula maris]|uniref:General stress protein 69 n=1 Tax=Pseudobythopirellula maris TaxID=2527991 RepID=A0A5C5ZSF1_9BACT|nr:aldo/keto reductase [Pseudobythopirellula maris]TWT90190.1 General stress protein 69 [Pseudobythopirellula maris]